MKIIKEIIEEAKYIVEDTKELWQEEEFRKSMYFPLFSLIVSTILLSANILLLLTR